MDNEPRQHMEALRTDLAFKRERAKWLPLKVALIGFVVLIAVVAGVFGYQVGHLHH